MRAPVNLVRDGAPFDSEELAEGDEVSYDILTGDVLRIVDKNGKEKWKSARPMPDGKLGRMIAATR